MLVLDFINVGNGDSTLVREMLRYDRPLAAYIPPETEALLRRIRQGKV